MADIVRSTEPLLHRVQRIEESMRMAGLTPVDMRRAGTLETDIQLPVMGEDYSLDLPTLELLEGPIAHREIERRNETRFRWFVDGSQKTMPIWRIGVVPIVVSIAVAGVLERDANGECHLLPGSLAETIAWIVPEQAADPDIRRVAKLLREDLGQQVIDPLDHKPNYQQLVGMYDQVLFYANEASGKVRRQTEQAALDSWRDWITGRPSDDWLLVDGRLTIDTRNAVGLIKDPGRQHLAGEDAITLLNLPAGNRTTAYRLTEAGRTRTHWYQRMWPGTGLDARHALIRIEASGDTADSDEIDAIASWLMAERIPRPTADSRWPTLLYPIHLLERMLKRRIGHITAGWPV